MRLTIPDEPIEGGLRRPVVDVRAVREQAMTLYWRLKEYEDTGLEPEDIEGDRTPTNWVPVESATPDELQEVLATDGQYVYLVEYDSDYGYGDMEGITAWMPLPEPYQEERL